MPSPILPSLYRQVRTVSLLMAAAASALALTGCSWEDLSDREFIMMCSGQVVMGARETYDDLALLGGAYEGIALPTAAALRESAGRYLNNVNGFSYDVGRFDGNVSGHPVGGFRGPRTTYNGQIRVSAGSLGRPAHYHAPGGQSRITHYYLTRNGELHPVNSFSLARISARDRVHSLHIAGVLPSDATYAVYHIDMRDVPFDPPGRPAQRVNGLAGYWVTPLTDEYRYQPLNAEHGDVLDARSRRLGPYVTRHLSHSPHGNGRASDDVRTAPCFMQPGSAHSFNSFFFDPSGTSAANRPEGYALPDGLHLPRSGARFGHGRIFFIGSRDALEDLPRNPRRFKGETGLLWPELPADTTSFL